MDSVEQSIAQQRLFNDRDFGFVRVTLDQKRKVMLGGFFAAYSEARGTSGLPALADLFTLDLAKHRVGAVTK